jgi:hypothetical protein
MAIVGRLDSPDKLTGNGPHAGPEWMLPKLPADDNERTRHVVEAIAAVAARGGSVAVFEHASLVGEPEYVIEAWVR